jgi:hypothetical protein
MVMSQPSDVWFVRLPDGRVLRAASTHVLRQHLGSGRIPSDSRVRRSVEEEWVALDWTTEFGDLVRHHTAEGNAAGADARTDPAMAAFQPLPRPSGIASRLDSGRLVTVGLRSLAEELIAALDSSLARQKLAVAAATALAAAITAAASIPILNSIGLPGFWIALSGVALAVLAMVSVCNVLVTQTTYVELSRLRPATWAEATAHWLRFSLRLLLAYLVAGGGAALGIALFRWLPEALLPAVQPEAMSTWHNVVTNLAAVISLVGEIILWPMLGFTLLLGPVVVVEECSVAAALRQWWWLVRRHLGRLLLYESAAVLGGFALLPFTFPVVLAAWGRWGQWGGLDNVIGLSLVLLAGLAAAPLLAYQAVAHVFLYLNLRYEYDRRGR